MRKIFLLLFSIIFVFPMLFTNGAAQAKDIKPPKTLTVIRVTTETIYVKGKTEGKAKVEVKVGKKLLGKATAVNKGDFKVKIKAQKKGTKLTVIAKDKAGNAKKVTVTVYEDPKPVKKEPVYETPKPLNVSNTVEKDGIKFDVTFSSKDFKPNSELTATVKATNISEEAIPYISFSGCDRGVKATILADHNGQVFTGIQNYNGISCNTAVKNYTIAPGETIEAIQEFYLPAYGLNDHIYAKVTFQKGTYPSYPLEPTEVQIVIKE